MLGKSAAKRGMKEPVATEVVIEELKEGSATFCILGRSPLILHSFSNKARQELLLPGAPKNRAARSLSLKHNPVAEMRGAAYLSRYANGPTVLALPASCFKAALRTAALDLPGASKALIGRLTWIESEELPLWGVPQLMMSMVRNSDPGRTPDVRTRPILASWATEITVRFARPHLTHEGIARLLARAGVTVGVGDWRQEKGSGSYGQFALVEPKNPQYVGLLANAGREAQERALAEPQAYDVESDRLLAYFTEHAAKRGLIEGGEKQITEATDHDGAGN